MEADAPHEGRKYAIYVLGAGFSVPAGIPAADKLWREILARGLAMGGRAGKPYFVGEKSGFMTAVSKVPGMNAMAMFHDNWAVSWDMNNFTTAGTILPATVLTYIGTGSSYYATLQRAAVSARRHGAALSADQIAVAAGTAAREVAEPEARAKTSRPEGSPQTSPIVQNSPRKTDHIVCRAGRDVRRLDTTSKASTCSIRYKSHGTTRTIWSSAHHRDFCTGKAEAVAITLSRAGFACER